MRIGNVIRSPHGSMWIVTNINDRTVSAVAFDYSNATATQLLEDHTVPGECDCENGDPCHKCDGTGWMDVQVKGWKHSEVLADSVKEFILDGFRRTFGLSKF